MDKHTSVRNVNIDILKGICTYLVIVIHCGFPFWGSYVDAEARVAVPLLFMISGYYCKGEWSEMKRKVIHLLKIFAVSEVVYFIYHILTRGDEWAEWLRAAITMNAVWELLLRNSTRVFMVGWF